MKNCHSLKQITLLRIATQFLTNSGHLSEHTFWRDSYENLVKLKNISKCIQKLELPKELIENLLCIIKSMWREIFKWVSYLNSIGYYDIIDLSLKTLCWTHQGRIDQGKSIRLLVKKPKLDNVKHFMLLCIFCLEDDITILFNKMSDDNGPCIEAIKKYSLQNVWVDFWTKKLWLEPSFPDQNSLGLIMAIETRNLAAVQYFWQISSNTWKIQFSEGTLNPKLLSQSELVDTIMSSSHAAYSEDIFYFLFSQLNEIQQLNILKYDITKSIKYSRDCFLKLPYQKYFLQTINRIWNFLPLETYVNLVQTIFYKIARREEDYDYHSLILELWSLSADYKSYFRRESFSFDPFQKLFIIYSFNSSDAAVIICIAENASVEEKEILQFDIHGKDLCHILVKELKFELVELLIRKCISSEEIIRKFKQDIIFSIEGSWFVNFISQNRLKDLGSFINWCLLSGEDDSNKESKVFEEDLYKYRFEVIKKFFQWCLLSTDVISETSGELQIKNKFEIVESLINWCFTTKQELNKLQRDLMTDINNYCKSEIFEKISKYELEDLQNCITWCRLSKEEGNHFKKCLIYSMWDENKFKNLNYRINFIAIKRFITWCDLPEEENKEIKKSLIYFLKDKKRFQILITDSRIELIQDFINFCLSSEVEISTFKKDLLYSTLETKYYFEYVFYKGNKDLLTLNIALIKEIKIEKMNKFINWFLSSAEDISKFKVAVMISVCKDKTVRSKIYNNFNEYLSYKFISWCSPLYEGHENKLEYMNKIISWGLLTKEETDLMFSSKSFIYQWIFNWTRKFGGFFHLMRKNVG